MNQKAQAGILWALLVVAMVGVGSLVYYIGFAQQTVTPEAIQEQAKASKIPNFTGISDPYENPKNPELTIDTAYVSVTQAVDLILNHLKNAGFLE